MRINAARIFAPGRENILRRGLPMAARKQDAPGPVFDPAAILLPFYYTWVR